MEEDQGAGTLLSFAGLLSRASASEIFHLASSQSLLVKIVTFLDEGRHVSVLTRVEDFVH